MSNFQQQGEIVRISDRRQVSDRLTVRDLVIRTEGDYPQIIIFQLGNAKCDQVDNLHPGERVNVHFNLRGREWTNPQGEAKVFNTLDAWKVELVAGDGSGAGQANSQQQASQPQATRTPPNDLPF